MARSVIMWCYEFMNYFFLEFFYLKFTKKESQRLVKFHTRYIKSCRIDIMSQEEYSSGLQLIGEWRIPLSCPNCKSVLSLEGFVVPSKTLKAEYWHVCNHCGFERSVDDFKKELLTV